MDAAKIEAKRLAQVPKGAAVVKSKLSPAVVYLYINVRGFPSAKGFYGNAIKPGLFYFYPTIEARTASVTKYLKACDEAYAHKLARKADRKAKLAAPQTAFKVGDVLYSSWGYDQTNVDFYEVVELVGKRSVKICAIAQEREATGHDMGRATPKKGKYIGEPLLKKVDEYNAIRLTSFSSAWKLEPVVVDGVEVGYGSIAYSEYA